MLLLDPLVQRNYTGEVTAPEVGARGRARPAEIQRGETSRETLEHLPVPRGAPKELDKDLDKDLE